MKQLLQRIFLLLAVGLLTGLTASHLQAQLLINTIAGEVGVSGTDGDGGPARQAHFFSMTSSTTDRYGNIYLVDGFPTGTTPVIRKINSKGIVSRYAGTGAVDTTSGKGSSDGNLAINAILPNVGWITTDSVGNVYLLIASVSYAAIRKIDVQTGLLTTIVSSDGTTAFTAGVLAKDARFYSAGPRPFAVNAQGDIYIVNAETSETAFYKIDHATGMISLYADVVGQLYDDGTPVNVNSYVDDLIIDPAGNLYWADAYGHSCIYKMTAAGVVSRFAGVFGSYYDASGDGGAAVDASLFNPCGVALDKEGNLLICDQFNCRIRKVDIQTNVITTIAGTGDFDITGDGGPAVNAALSIIRLVRTMEDGSIIIISPDYYIVRKVAERLVTFTFDTISVKTYGDTAFVLNAYASNASAPVFRSDNPGAIAVTADGHATIAGTGTATLFADFPAIGTDTAVTRMQTITVVKKELTVTANNQTITIDDPVPVLTFRYEGFVNGEDSMNLTTLPVATTTATDASPEGNYPIAVDGGVADNYAFTYVNGTLHIAARVLKPQTITFTTIVDKTYGDADFATGAVSNNATIPVTFKSSDVKVATVSSTGIVHVVGAGQVTITASQAADAFYTAAPDVAQTFTVNKALLSIIADNQTKAYGADMPVLNLTYSGWKNEDTVSALSVVPKTATAATKTSGTGTYPITISIAMADNYTFEYHEGVLTITALTQTISFPALSSKTYADGDFNGGATSTNVTVPVTYSSSNTAVATIDANGFIHIVGVGATTITASQAGNGNYTAATDKTQPLTVTAAPLIITPDDKKMVQGQTLPVFTISYSGFKQGETEAVLTTQPVVTTSVNKNSYPGLYTINASGAAAGDHYLISYQPGNLRVLADSTKANDQLNAWMSSPSQLQVNVFTATNQKATIEIFSLYGQRVATQQVYLVYASNTFHIPVANVASGLYVVRVTGQYIQLTQKIRIDH